jgi:hypothetical protein
MNKKLNKENKKIKTNKIKNIETTPNYSQKREDRNGFPDPIPANCFKCQEQF